MNDDVLDVLVIRLGNDVYASCGILEFQEPNGNCSGNGHHARQDLARYAQAQLLSRWCDKDQAARVAKKRGIELK